MTAGLLTSKNPRPLLRSFTQSRLIPINFQTSKNAYEVMLSTVPG